MEDLFQKNWYGRYWLKLVMNERLLLIVIVALIILVYLATKITRR